MPTDLFAFVGSDDTTLYAYAFLPPTPPRGILQIAHGMGEHSERYSDFAVYLNQAGFAVFANDHRGHGATAEHSGILGYFADKDGWELVVNDMRALSQIATARLPGLPVYLLGHSMGSLLARSYAQRFGKTLAGLILSSTTLSNSPLLITARLISRLESLRCGPTKPSQFLHDFTFNPFIKSVSPHRTDYDWLSRDQRVVDEYIADPWCGGVFTAGFYCDLADGLADICAKDSIAHIPKNLPVFIISGTNDPMSHMGRDTVRLAEMLMSAGLKDVSHHLYEGGRHELLNETNKAEVYRDIFNWIKQKTPPVSTLPHSQS